MQVDFDDLRFTESDAITSVDAWLESKVDGSTANIWVEFPTTPADGVEQTYYMYYGNSGDSNDWNIGDTFIFGDDFSGDLSKWIVDVGTPDIVDDPDGSGQKVMRLAPGVESVISDTDFSALSYVFDYDIRGDSLNDSGVGGVSSAPWNAGDYQVLALGHPTDGFFGYIKAGSGWTNSGHPYAINTWYDIEHTRERGVQFKIYQNGTHIGTVADTTTTQDACIFRATTGDSMWIKNPRIRKYASNPATYALGSEESEVVILSPIHYLNKSSIKAIIPETGTTKNVYEPIVTMDLHLMSDTTIVIGNTLGVNEIDYKVELYSDLTSGVANEITNTISVNNSDQILLGRHAKVVVSVKSTVDDAHSNYNISCITGR